MFKASFTYTQVFKNVKETKHLRKFYFSLSLLL